MYHMMLKVVRLDLRSITGIRAKSVGPFVNAVDRSGIVNSVKVHQSDLSDWNQISPRGRHQLDFSKLESDKLWGCSSIQSLRLELDKPKRLLISNGAI